MAEPVVVTNAIGELIRTGILLGIAFGLAVSTSQLAAIMLFVGAAMITIQIIVTRNQVVPVEKAASQIEVGVRSPVGTSVEDVIKKEAKENK